MQTFPFENSIHAQFNSSEALRIVASRFSEDRECACQLHQLALQANFGKILVQQLIERYSAADPLTFEGTPLPSVIKAADGRSFRLSPDKTEYNAADGSRFTLIQLLRWIAMSPQERASEPFPQFEVAEWIIG